MMRSSAGVSLLMAFTLAGANSSQAASHVAKRVVRANAAGLAERLVNGSFETRGEANTPAAGWEFWQAGYAMEHRITRSENGAIRCISADPELQYGAGQTILLNQSEPLPIIAGGWSKAEHVSGTPDGGYSVYVDIIYKDGTPLWGQIRSFDTGTHDWQYREVIVVPSKPIRELRVYALFRGHTGTVYFDDFSVKELAPPEGARLFDGVPVTAKPAPARQVSNRRHRLDVGRGLVLEVDSKTGALVVPGLGNGGFLVRDVAANSDFLQPLCTVTSQNGGRSLRMAGLSDELAIRLEAVLTVHDGALWVDGQVRDLRGQDRAIAVYFVFPANFVGGEFGLDVRHSTPIQSPTTYANFVTINAGTNGKMSRYPIAPIVHAETGLCIATPLDAPRVSRLAYDAASKELYAAFDLGVSTATKKFPSTATFSLVLYGFEPEWGFRAALADYYRLFPQLFTKRVTQEGIWMPFTDIATVQEPADFGFMFKEGDNNVAWDEAHGIYSFVYVEPMSHWLPLGPQVPRTYDAVMTELKRRAETDSQAQATIQSAATKPDGTYQLSIQKAPWCDGALIINNADPDLLSDQPGAFTQAQHEFAAIERAFQRASGAMRLWRSYGEGYQMTDEHARTGKGSIRCTNTPGQQHGAAQTVVLNQKEPQTIIARAWSRAEGVTGEQDNDYSIYLDLVHADGTPSWGHVAPFRVGTHDWEQAELTIRPTKPVQAVTLHLLLRNQHGGTVWFDDVFLGQGNSPENLAQEPGFEPSTEPGEPAELDGMYIDSFEMAATTQNFRREQWAYGDIPLAFTLHDRQVCSLVIFHTYEFARELARRMHDRGKLLFANAVLARFAFPAHVLDVMGIETNWAPGGKYTPNSDEIMNFRRAMCYQKPYLLLLNTDYKAFKPEWVELYFKRCTFYAIFPSFFSHNAADDPYWQNPILYNRDRPIFQRYIPIICRLNAAGWEPITWARVQSEDDSVYVERFGKDASEGIYLTLFNDSQKPRRYRLSVAVRNLGLSPDAVRTEELLSGQEVRLRASEETVETTGHIGPEDAQVIRLSRP